jgi:single-stranded DNA-binding protein
MQPILIVTKENFDDLLAMNLFIATGGLGPKSDEVELDDTTVTNRSLAWQNDEKETSWFKLSAFGELSKQLSELAPGTPTIAVGKVSSSTKDEKTYLNYTVDKVLYLPKSSRTTPKKAADPEKGKVTTAALGSIDFSL